MQTLSIDSYNSTERKSFSEILHKSKDELFTYDLSQYNLVQCMEKMIITKSKLHPNMHKNYSFAIEKIKLLQKEYDCILKPIQITGVFWVYFIEWLSGEQKIKYSSIKTIKCQILSTLNWASKYGAKIHPSFDSVEVPKYSRSKIALTPSDIAHIYYTDFDKVTIWSERYNKRIKLRSDKRKTLERVRDQFVLACNLGQRYSDVVRIKKEYFKNGVFSMIQQKTGNRCKVVLDNMSIDKKITFDILNKYGYEPPYKHDISNFNKYLREVLQIAGRGFDSTITVENKMNGTIVEERAKRWKLITSHTARRSFATINDLKGISRQRIMKATGHVTESSFIKYICDDEYTETEDDD